MKVGIHDLRHAFSSFFHFPRQKQTRCSDNLDKLLEKDVEFELGRSGEKSKVFLGLKE